MRCLTCTCGPAAEAPPDIETNMGQTNAERQMAYRARHLGPSSGKEILNLLIEAPAKKALDRLAAHYGINRAAMLERLVTNGS